MKKKFEAVSLNVSFPELEKKLLEKWYKTGLVQKYLTRNQGSPKRFSFLDGPITANNPMGVHHAWGRTYKDLWQRFYTLRGYEGRYQNGFDCQGLWVEVEVEKELGVRAKKDIENLVPGNKFASIAKFVTLCKERVKKFSAIQTEQSKRLGYFMDWDNSYFTMSDENNYMIWNFLKKCHEKGWLYKGTDSVPWCPRCETAISQHEMLTEDYKEITHDTVFVKLPLKSPGWEGISLLVWTTTPWTVPANVAVGINLKYEYAVWKNEKTAEAVVIIAKDEAGNEPTRPLGKKQIPVSEYIFGRDFPLWKQKNTVSGVDLVGLVYEAPFDFLPRVGKARAENPEAFHRVVDASLIVVSGEGTGLLHVAPGAGKEDYDLAKKGKLPVISVIDDDAAYLDGLGDWSGQNAKKHPELIIDFLTGYEKRRFLLRMMKYTHRYPACWRCKAELVWKVTEEWYLGMDINEKPKTKDQRPKAKTLREQMIEVAKKINWHPAFGLERELDWLTNMQDWLISKKNRYWGLALPIYECDHCHWFDVIGSKEELAKRCVSGWDKFNGQTPHKPQIDAVKIRCEKCGRETSRIDDVGNVWLDAGIVPYATLVDPATNKVSYTGDRNYWHKWFPADFITESFPGQFKNWFYSMIAMSTVLEKTNPYQTVLGYGSMLGEDGRPMHKSWGNAIEFNEGAEKIGADVMRWMFVTHDPEQNLLFGYKKADETRRRFHLLLWNVYNFFVTYANASSWEPGKKRSNHPEHVLDRYILSYLMLVNEKVTKSLEAYDVMTAARSLEKFVVDLSQWYIRRSRTRVEPFSKDKDDLDSCFAVLNEVLIDLSVLLAPFNPFIAEMIYTNLTGAESVHLANWPSVKSRAVDPELMEQMEFVRTVVEAIHAKRKALGIKVRQPLAGAEIMAPAKVPHDLVELIADEVNIRKIELKVSEGLAGEITVKLDEKITPELKKEGQIRELIRSIQKLRKEKGFVMTQKAVVALPGEFRNLSGPDLDLISQATMASKIVWGNSLNVSIG
jgi:isoleucyl-tRNA synthetase